MKKNWVVYIILTAKGTYYTGISNDIEKRLAQHRAGKGAKFFRFAPPKKVLYLEKFSKKSDALKREHTIKKLSRKKKSILIKSSQNSLSQPLIS